MRLKSVAPKPWRTALLLQPDLARDLRDRHARADEFHEPSPRSIPPLWRALLRRDSTALRELVDGLPSASTPSFALPGRTYVPMSVGRTSPAQQRMLSVSWPRADPRPADRVVAMTAAPSHRGSPPAAPPRSDRLLEPRDHRSDRPQHLLALARQLVRPGRPLPPRAEDRAVDAGRARARAARARGARRSTWPGSPGPRADQLGDDPRQLLVVGRQIRQRRARPPARGAAAARRSGRSVSSSSRSIAHSARSPASGSATHSARNTCSRPPAVGRAARRRGGVG